MPLEVAGGREGSRDLPGVRSREVGEIYRVWPCSLSRALCLRGDTLQQDGVDLFQGCGADLGRRMNAIRPLGLIPRC